MRPTHHFHMSLSLGGGGGGGGGAWLLQEYHYVKSLKDPFFSPFFLIDYIPLQIA